jgi:hypothetical protein
MVAPAIKLEGGIQIEGGTTISGTSGGGGYYGTAGVNGAVGYTEIGGPVIPNQQIEDISATVNDPIGFTINDDTATGVAISNLSASNQTFFASYGTGMKTVYWGPGSTVVSSTVNLTTNSGGLVFYIQGQSGPATYNYPFTFI